MSEWIIICFFAGENDILTKQIFFMKRLKIYSIVLIVVLVAYSMPSMMSYFIQGFEAGYSSVEQHYADVSSIAIHPDHGSYYSDVDIARIDSTVLPMAVANATVAIPEELMVTLQQKESYPLYRTSEIVMMVCSFPIMIGIIWLFILVIRVLFSVLRTKVFDYTTIKRINHIGWILLSVELVAGVSILLRYIALSKVVDFGAYHITYWESFDIANIIIAIIVLLMNELLRIATGMKEEQDLTI